MPETEFASRTASPAAPSHEGFTARRIELALWEAIVSLKIRPGTRLSEQEVADHYRVSRQPVRQALSRTSRNQRVWCSIPRESVTVRGECYECVSDRALRRADCGYLVLLRPCGDHRHHPGDLLRGGDDPVPVCQRDPHLRLSRVRPDTA